MNNSDAMGRGLRRLCGVTAVVALGVLSAEGGQRELGTPAGQGIEVRNPYAWVDWESAQRHRANLHTHTRASGGPHEPADFIAAYRGRGYTVLALTDHNQVSWPWSRFGMDPKALGMLAVQGAELIRHHHLGSYFSDYTGSADDLDGKLEAIAKAGGLAILFHPGRYQHHPKWTLEWRVALYRQHAVLLGMEVFNKGNRYPSDMALWDALLTELMPERLVWGFSNDDAYTMRDVGRCWQTFFVEALTEAQLRQAMQRGQFVFSLSPQGRGAPEIKAITLDTDQGMLHVQGSGYHTVTWIADGEELHNGETLNLATLTSATRYVRARLVSDEGATYTQPFGIVTARPTSGKEVAQSE